MAAQAACIYGDQRSEIFQNPPLVQNDQVGGENMQNDQQDGLNIGLNVLLNQQNGPRTLVARMLKKKNRMSIGISHLGQGTIEIGGMIDAT